MIVKKMFWERRKMLVLITLIFFENNFSELPIHHLVHSFFFIRNSDLNIIIRVAFYHTILIKALK